MDLTHIANPVRVNAARIRYVKQDGETGRVSAEVEDGSEVAITDGMVARYWPRAGDYIVTQEDGYVYVNPKDVFERKYSPIG